MTPDRPDSPFDAAHLDHEAAAWLIKRDRGFTPAEQDEFFEWLAADPRHGECFSRHQETWRELNGLAEWRPEHSAEPNPDLLARPVRGPRVWFRRPRRAMILAAVAAAACLAVVFSLVLPSRPVPAPVAIATCEQRTLEDGTVIELNRGAEIKVAYTAGERRVTLVRGEALFTVAKNPARPFIVDAAGVAVRAIGTAFNVRLQQGQVEVLVTEGLVTVDHPVTAPAGATTPAAAASVPSAFVAAGQHAVVSLAANDPVPQVTEVTPAQAADLLAWQPRLLDFDSAALALVVDAFNRHNRDLRLVLADPALSAIPIVASIRSDNVEGFVRLLEQTAGIRAERRGDTLTLYPARR